MGSWIDLLSEKGIILGLIFDNIYVLLTSVFSHKQMVFPAIKALFTRILMRIFVFLPGFFYFAVKNYRIFDQIFVF